ncbi:hypothetical protein ACUOFC_27580, partial [Escherichia sp. TWPC-MK]
YLVAIIAGTLVAGLAYAFLKRPEVVLPGNPIPA